MIIIVILKEKILISEIDDMLEIMEMPYKFFENSFWLKGMFEKAKEEGHRSITKW